MYIFGNTSTLFTTVTCQFHVKLIFIGKLSLEGM